MLCQRMGIYCIQLHCCAFAPLFGHAECCVLYVASVLLKPLSSVLHAVAFGFSCSFNFIVRYDITKQIIYTSTQCLPNQFIYMHEVDIRMTRRCHLIEYSFSAQLVFVADAIFDHSGNKLFNGLKCNSFNFDANNNVVATADICYFASCIYE